MKIEILSPIPCSLFCKGRQKETPTVISTNTCDRLQLSILPVCPEKYLSYTLIIVVENDKIVDISGGAKAVCWGNGFAQITLSPPIAQIRFTPKILAQKRMNNDLVTLYDDGQKKIMCEGSSFYTFDLPNDIQKLVFKAKDLGTCALISIEGIVNDKKYLLALYSNGQEWKIMHEIISNEIISTDKGIKTIDIIPSMLRLEKRAFYKAFLKEPESQEYVPTFRHSYPDQLVPYLFFENVFLGNENAISYLDDSLPQNLEAIKEFIGEVDTVCFPALSGYDLDTIALYNGNLSLSFPDLYEIQVEKGKIINIIHLLTCN